MLQILDASVYLSVILTTRYTGTWILLSIFEYYWVCRGHTDCLTCITSCTVLRGGNPGPDPSLAKILYLRNWACGCEASSMCMLVLPLLIAWLNVENTKISLWVAVSACKHQYHTWTFLLNWPTKGKQLVGFTTVLLITFYTHQPEVKISQTRKKPPKFHIRLTWHCLLPWAEWWSQEPRFPSAKQSEMLALRVLVWTQFNKHQQWNPVPNTFLLFPHSDNPHTMTDCSSGHSHFSHLALSNLCRNTAVLVFLTVVVFSLSRTVMTKPDRHKAPRRDDSNHFIQQCKAEHLQVLYGAVKGKNATFMEAFAANVTPACVWYDASHSGFCLWPGTQRYTNSGVLWRAYLTVTLWSNLRR